MRHKPAHSLFALSSTTLEISTSPSTPSLKSTLITPAATAVATMKSSPQKMAPTTCTLFGTPLRTNTLAAPTSPSHQATGAGTLKLHRPWPPSTPSTRTTSTMEISRHGLMKALHLPNQLSTQVSHRYPYLSDVTYSRCERSLTLFFIGVVEGQALSSEYVASAQDALGYQIMYGGYRLNNLLQSIYGGSNGFLQ